MRYFKNVYIFFLIAFVSGCITSSNNIDVNEIKVEIISPSETIHIDNCDGKTDFEQKKTRYFEVTIVGFENDSNYQKILELVTNQYSQFQETNITSKLITPPGTNMEFNLNWKEEIYSGVIKNGNSTGYYNIRVPISIDRISNHDLGCAIPISPIPTSTQVIGAIVNTQLPTHTLTSTATATFSGDNTEKLSYCTQVNKTDCIYLIRPSVDKTLSFYFNIEERGRKDYYCSFEMEKYEMRSIAGYDGKYGCLGLPSNRMDQTVTIQIFTSDSLIPILEGQIFLDRTKIIPTETPKPPDPYKP